MKKKQLFTYNRVLYTLLSIGGLFLLYRFFQQKELIKNSLNTKAVIIWIGQTRGKRVGQPEFEYEFMYNKNKYHRTAERFNYNVQVGDTIEIKFSVEDPRVSEVLYDKFKGK